MSNAREAIAAACQYISILKIENQNIKKQRDELLEALKEANKELRGGIKEKTTALIAKAEGKS